MHPTFTSAVANTRLHGELVLHFTTLLEQRRLCELYVRMDTGRSRIIFYGTVPKD